MLLYRILWSMLWVLRHTWWRWSISGLDRLPPAERGMILAVNHMHWLDTFVIRGSLPLSWSVSWLAKAELYRNPVLGWWLRAVGAIPVNRGARDMRALAAADDALRNGAVLIIFVEGHRSETGGLQVGHPGAIRLSARTGCPIVPVGLVGTERGLRGAFLRQPIEVRIGEPYCVTPDTSNIPPPIMSELVDAMMLRLAALLPERYWGVYRERMLASGPEPRARNSEPRTQSQEPGTQNSELRTQN